MFQFDCILIQVPLYFGNPRRRFLSLSIFFLENVSWQVEAKSRSGGWEGVWYVDAGPATQDYNLITVNVCKAIHTLRLYWSTQMHRHLQTHQSGNTKSTLLTLQYMRCVLIALEGWMITIHSVNSVRCAVKGNADALRVLFGALRMTRDFSWIQAEKNKDYEVWKMT